MPSETKTPVFRAFAQHPDGTRWAISCEYGVGSDTIARGLTEPEARALAADLTNASRMRRALEAVMRNDKTPMYPYGNSREARNNDGALPAAGQRWLLPREIASEALQPATPEAKETM